VTDLAADDIGRGEPATSSPASDRSTIGHPTVTFQGPATHDTQRARIATRRQLILDTLRANPMSTSHELSQTILHETGGTPTILTGALSIAPHTVHADLVALERNGNVGRWQDRAVRRSIEWQAI
jgi:hypothetical protein